MKKGAICLCSMMTLAMAGVANATLLTNGTLDDTYQQEIVPGFFLPKPTAWENIGTRAITGPYEDELSSEEWAGPAPTPVTTGTNATFPGGAGKDAGVFFKAFSGNATNGKATGHLQQTVAGTAGMMYKLTGWAGAEANFMADGAEFAIDFLDASGGLLGSAILDLKPTLFVANGQPFNYKFYTVQGVSPAGTTNVRARVSMIGGSPNPAGGGQAFVVDDFEMTSSPVPEPATLATLSLGALALLRRRRSAK